MLLTGSMAVRRRISRWMALVTRRTWPLIQTALLPIANCAQIGLTGWAASAAEGAAYVRRAQSRSSRTTGAAVSLIARLLLGVEARIDILLARCAAHQTCVRY
jgi:hypothetical protein